MIFSKKGEGNKVCPIDIVCAVDFIGKFSKVNPVLKKDVRKRKNSGNYIRISTFPTQFFQCEKYEIGRKCGIVAGVSAFSAVSASSALEKTKTID